jgi:hypothetical protein
MSKYHYSPNLGAYAECRAKKEECPFGGSREHHTVPELAQIHARAVEDGIKSGKQLTELPKARFKDTKGVEKEIIINNDGSYSIGARTYSKNGRLIVAEETERVRHWREVQAWKTLADSRTLDPATKHALDSIVGQPDEQPSQEVLDADDEARQRWQEGRDLQREHEFYRALFRQSLVDAEADALADRLSKAMEQRAIKRKQEQQQSLRKSLPESYLWKSYKNDPTSRGIFGWFARVCASNAFVSSFMKSFRQTYKGASRGNAAA